MADEKIIATSSEEVTEKADLQTEQAETAETAEQADLQSEQAETAETAEQADLQSEKKETKKNKPCTRWRHKRFK